MHKKLFITTFIFFALVNSQYYWQPWLGAWAMFASLFLLLAFFALTGLLAYQFILLAAGSSRSRSKRVLVAVMTILLALTIYRPFGIINFESNDGSTLLEAKREGAANCMTTFKLKANGRFSERSVCFGITNTNGNYLLKADTVFFSAVEPGRAEEEYYQFAVIKNSGSPVKGLSQNLVLYKNYSDSLPHELWITINELVKKHS